MGKRKEVQERKLLIMEKFRNFIQKVEEMSQNPALVTQENSIKLVYEADTIIQEIKKIESLDNMTEFEMIGFGKLVATMEYVKHRLLEGLFTTSLQDNSN